MLISQHPCSKVVSARVRKWGLAQGQDRQTKSNKEAKQTHTYVIKVIRFKQGRGYGS
jgi:hypothetical protein